jgi:hypothetical protein
MDNKRELIKKIKSDKTLTDKEKNIKIQQLMSNNYYSVIQQKSNESIICSHYEKKCSKFVFECCNIIDPCKRCHIERGCCDLENVNVREITCIKCNLSQKPNKQCIGCGSKFANSYCEKCQIWTNKEIYHCIYCGLCRIGTQETIFHCMDCGICFNKDDNNLQTHKCIGKKYADSICVVCSESTFNSQSESFFLECGHFIHKDCYYKYIQQNRYNCPYCKKSICQMSEHWNYIRKQIKLYPLTNDILSIEVSDIVDTNYGKFKIDSIDSTNEIKLFRGKFINWFRDKKKSLNVEGILNNSMIKKNIYKKIHCNDCGKNSTSKFHFYGIECYECGSFNTQE